MLKFHLYRCPIIIFNIFPVSSVSGWVSFLDQAFDNERMSLIPICIIVSIHQSPSGY